MSNKPIDTRNLRATDSRPFAPLHGSNEIDESDVVDFSDLLASEPEEGFKDEPNPFGQFRPKAEYKIDETNPFEGGDLRLSVRGDEFRQFASCLNAANGNPEGEAQLTFVEDMIRGRTFDGALFCERDVPISNAVWPDGGETPPSLVLYIADLLSAAEASGGQIHLSLDLKGRILHLRSGNFERPIAMAASRTLQLTEARAEIDAISCDTHLHAASILKAVKYVAPAVTLDSAESERTTLFFQDGVAAGGSKEVVARFVTKEDLRALSIRRSFFDFFERLLPHLGHPVRLIQTPTFTFMSDTIMTIGFEAARFSLPDISFPDAPYEKLSFRRNELVDVVEKLGGIDADRLRLLVRKAANGGTQNLKIFGIDGGGRQVTASVRSIERANENSLGELDVFVSAPGLQVALSGSKSREVSLNFLLDRNYLLIEDDTGSERASRIVKMFRGRNQEADR